MTTDRPWADLPNAKHIDAVLADVKARPEVWKAALDAALGAAWVAALGAVGDVIRALVAWGEAGDLVDLPPDVLRTMADLAPEPVNHQAVLLLPWTIVREAT